MTEANYEPSMARSQPLNESASSPTLQQTGASLSGSSASSTGGPRNAQMSDAELKHHLRGKIIGIVRSRSGPSFEDRVNEAARRRRKEADETERAQKEILASAVARGRSQPTSCPFRSEEPESIDERAKRGRQEVKKRELEYWDQVEDLRHRMATREPLYKLEEVAAAVKELEDRQAARKKELKQEERDRWRMIRSLKEKVIDRPLVMEEFEKRALNETDLRRMANRPPEPMGIERKIAAAVAKKSYTESQWAEQVEQIKQRINDRVPLHEQKYPPYVPPNLPVRPRELGPIEKQIEAAMANPSYAKSQWAEQVKDLQEKMNGREKLHEITYPKKWEDPPPSDAPSPLRLQIQAKMAEKVEENRVKMLAEERKQRAILRQIKEAALTKRDRSALGLK